MASASSPTLFSLTFIFLYCFFVLCTHVPSSSSVSFSYNFSNPSIDDPCGHDIVCHPDAEFVRSTSAIELTKNQQTGTITYSHGRIWYAYPVPLWNEVTGEVTSFTTSFSFNITPTSSSQYQECNNWPSKSGDGMAFFLAPWPYSSGGVVLANATGGGDLDIFDPSNRFNATGDSRVVAVEFDTFFGGDNTWDINGQHIGIDVNSIKSVVTSVTLGTNNLTSPFTKAALVRYDNSTKMLTANLQIGDKPYHVNATVDLKRSLPGTVAVGFSASTGYCVDLHELLSWSFNSTLEMKAETSPTKLLVRVLVPVTSVILVCAGVGLLLWKMRARRRNAQPHHGTESEESDEADFERGVTGPRRYHYRDLATATGEFAEDNLLGRGGFGTVYKGHLPSYDGQQQQVAIKKFSTESSSQSRKEFEAEVKIIGRLRHRNLVQLLGWCDSRKGLLLVYELVPEGSLDKHIYSSKRFLSWPERYKIILGLGSALHYLHRGWDQRVVHGDIKPSNIMLDSSYNAKLGDFGLARLGDHGTGPQTTDLVKGTMGYIDPEFVNTHRRSTESDMYSFGIVLLEIVSGRPPVSRLDPSFSLLKWVESLYCHGELLLDVADAQLRGDDEAHLRQMECALVVGLWCTQRDPGERPSVAEAMHALQSDCKLPTLISLHMHNKKPPPAGVSSTGSFFSSGVCSATAC
ncbi:unnamed protein product [Urochloa decumbens]|uniref:non-specific serine/threonine protein kinase n=1 Tax=Urochloa decumbens TaxID=240449 RepID=A0ABC9B145_9POAL